VLRSHDHRLDAIDSHLGRIETTLKEQGADIGIVERDGVLLRWICGFNVALTAAVLFKLLLS